MQGSQLFAVNLSGNGNLLMTDNVVGLHEWHCLKKHAIEWVTICNVGTMYTSCIVSNCTANRANQQCGVAQCTVTVCFTTKYNNSFNMQRKFIRFLWLHVSAQFLNHHQASIQTQITGIYNCYSYKNSFVHRKNAFKCINIYNKCTCRLSGMLNLLIVIP